MIIKSMARKEPSFKQLIDYFHKESAKNSPVISKNLLSDNKDDIVLEFENNSKYLPKRKGANYLYHEVITIPKQNKLSIRKQEKILLDLANQYLEKRAENLLSYGVIHLDTNNLHIHLMISANEPLSKKRFRLSKKKFADIQKEIEEYKLEKYPELETQKIYTKDLKKERTKTVSQKEYEVIKRGGTSKKKEIIELVENIFIRAENEKELDNLLAKINFKLYTRGKSIGLENIDTKRRYRLKTLGLETLYLEKIEQFERAKERLEELRQREQGRDTNKEVEKLIDLSDLEQKRLKQLQSNQAQGQDRDMDKDRWVNEVKNGFNSLLKRILTKPDELIKEKIQKTLNNVSKKIKQVLKFNERYIRRIKWLKDLDFRRGQDLDKIL